MLSFRRKSDRWGAIRPAGVAALSVLGMLAISGCTVQPLYGDISSSIAPTAYGQAPSAVASIGVKPVTYRAAQELRNHVIFSLNGGAAEPAQPRYMLELGVQSRPVAAARIQGGARENEPTAGALMLSASYSLTDTTTGRIVARGSRSTTATFDRPRQDFASLRALRNAEDRAARELAESLRIAIGQDLARLPAS